MTSSGRGDQLQHHRDALGDVVVVVVVVVEVLVLLLLLLLFSGLILIIMTTVGSAHKGKHERKQKHTLTFTKSLSLAQRVAPPGP